MKLTCNRENLISGVNIVQKAVPAKSTAEILQGILIEVGEELRFTGNDNEFGIVYEIPAIIEEIGSIVVNSKTFGDIVRKLPDIYVTLETINDGAMLSITSGHANYKIKAYPTESYPPVAFLDTSVSFDIKRNTCGSDSSDILCRRCAGGKKNYIKRRIYGAKRREAQLCSD